MDWHGFTTSFMGSPLGPLGPLGSMLGGGGQGQAPAAAGTDAGSGFGMDGTLAQLFMQQQGQQGQQPQNPYIGGQGLI